MACYSMYFLDSSGHILRAENKCCEDDVEAYEEARRCVDGTSGLEVWRDDRMILRMTPDGTAPMSN